MPRRPVLPTWQIVLMMTVGTLFGVPAYRWFRRWLR
jgi:hypothetical protein